MAAGSTWGKGSAAVEFMVFFDEERPVREDMTFNSPQIVWGKPPVAGKLYRGKPELTFAIAAAHMDVGRLLLLIGKK